jgi:hypothetical protein
MRRADSLMLSARPWHRRSVANPAGIGAGAFSAKADAPIVPLDRAFQRGWVKTYVLVDGIVRRPDAQNFRTILAAVNRSVWARDRSFVHHRTRRPIVLNPRVIPFREWEKLAWPASPQRLFERGMWRVLESPDRFPWERWVHGHKLVRTWWLREDTQPHLVTHQRVNLPEVEERLAEIESYMTRTRGWDRLGRLHGCSQWWRYLTKTQAEYQAGQSLADELCEIIPD